jgi:hypothetical protein
VEQNRQQQKEPGKLRQMRGRGTPQAVVGAAEDSAAGKAGRGNGGRRGPHAEGRGRASRCAGVRGEYTFQEACMHSCRRSERRACCAALKHRMRARRAMKRQHPSGLTATIWLGTLLKSRAQHAMPTTSSASSLPALFPGPSDLVPHHAFTTT